MSMMSNLNSVLIEGTLVSDPRTIATLSGAKVCRMTIESVRYFKTKSTEPGKETSQFEVDAWSGLGEKCAEVLSKGRGVRVVGRLTQDCWTDADGVKHERVKIVAEHVEFKPKQVPA